MGSLRVLAANITSLSPKAMKFLEENREFAAVAVGEHHVLEAEVPQYRHKLSKMGYASYWSPAAATQAGGTSGGAAVFVKNDVASSHFCPSLGELNSDALPFRDIAAVILDLGPSC